MKPYLSIIIPYHNSRETIGPLLRSIYASTHAPAFEVIVVDDGSEEKCQMPNDTWHINKKKHINPIRIILIKHNRGPAAARNRGAKEARGKFLVFLGRDVEIFSDKL